MSRLRLLGLPALLAGAILVAPTGGARAAVTVGISDQQAQTFADARLRWLRVRRNLAALAPLRWSVRWSTASRGRLVLRVTCPAAAGRCAGRVRIALRAAGRTQALARRTYRTATSRRTATLPWPCRAPCALGHAGQRVAASC